MNNHLKKLISCILTVLILMTAVPLSGLSDPFEWLNLGITASAEVDLAESGACGENATYTFDFSSGLLTVGGTGKIEGHAFRQRKEIRYVEIENGITEIGEYAFTACTNLMNVTIPDSVTTIDEFSFDGCISLTSITIPSSVTAIGNCTLGVLPIFVEEGSYAEQYCDENSLNKMLLRQIPEDTDSVGGEIGDNYSWSVDKNTETLTVTRMGTDVTFTDYAPWLTYKEYIRHIVIADGCTEIEKQSFKFCDKTETVTIPSSVKTVGEEAFSSCLNLKSVILPEGLESISTGAFMNCGRMAEAVIPSTVTALESKVFYNCIGMKNAVLPSALKSIDKYAFYNCMKIADVDISESVESIGEYAFEGCSGIENLSISCSLPLPNNGRAAFRGCTGVKKVTLTKGSGTMRDLFRSPGRNDISYIYTPWYESRESLTEIVIEDGITNIGSYMFYGLEKLTEINIPQTVNKIGEYSFTNCSALTSISLPNGVTSIGESAFSGCTGLKKISVPNSVTTIGSSAFEGCSGLTEFTVPSGLTALKYRTFKDCVSLKSIVALINVSTIQFEAFKGCTSLDSIYIYNRKCEFEMTVSESNTTIYGFLNSTAEYYASQNSMTFVPMDEEHTHVYDYDCDKICNICGFVRSAEHVYNSNCDESCLLCGQKRVAPHNDSDGDLYCDDCGAYLVDIELGKDKNIFVDRGEIVYLRFVAPYSGIFNFGTAVSPKGTVGYILDSNRNVLRKGEGYYENDDFCIDFSLTKGKLYYIGVQFYNPEDSGMVPVYIEYEDYYHVSNHIEHRDSTCTEHGYDKVVCDYCGEVISVTELPFKHSYTSVVTASTCTEKGYTTYTCSLCSYSYIGNYTSATNHPTRSWHMAKNPTVSSTGLMEEICDICGKKTNEKEIPMLKPDFVTGITLTPNKLALNVGDTANITAEVRPSTAIDRSVIWSSTDTDIATVDGGIVTAKAPGVAFIVAETADGGYKDFCIVRIASIIGTNGAVVDNENGVIYGITGRPESVVGYLETVDDSLTVQSETEPFGTGSIVNIVRNGKTIDSYKIVVFGDVNGDGWYDGQDAVTVSMIASGMLTREQVGEAVWIAADCNHDGIIDELDVDLLNRAGILLAEVDQSKSSQELLETSAEYVEYLNLIDQQGTTDAPSSEESIGFFEKIIRFLRAVIDYIVKTVSEFFRIK